MGPVAVCVVNPILESNQNAFHEQRGISAIDKFQALSMVMSEQIQTLSCLSA